MDDSEHGGEDIDQKAKDANDRRKATGENAAQTLDSQLGPELLAALEKQTAKPEEQVKALSGEVQRIGRGQRRFRRHQRSRNLRGERRFPPAHRVSLEQVNQFINVLGLSDPRIGSQAMYDDYRLAYDELLTKPLEEIAPEAAADSPAAEAEKADDHKAMIAPREGACRPRQAVLRRCDIGGRRRCPAGPRGLVPACAAAAGDDRRHESGFSGWGDGRQPASIPSACCWP